MSAQHSFAQKLRALSEIVSEEQREALNQAALIEESGRWAAFNTKLSGLAQAGVQDPWKLQVIAGLAATTFAEAHRIVSAAQTNGDEALLAWTVRNLLELSVWSKFAEKSCANMRRIFEDAGRDADELYRSVITELGIENQLATAHDHIFSGRNNLKARAAFEGIDDLESKFLDVRSAAKAIEFESEFQFYNKQLSKLAHPTAMRIVGTKTQEAETISRGFYLGVGCMFFSEAFTSQEQFLLGFDAANSAGANLKTD